MTKLFHKAIIVLIIIGFEGCNDCRKIECQNGSICFESECLCEKWYSGDRCDLYFTRNYEGLYSGSIDTTGTSEVAELNLIADEEIPNRLVLETGVYIEFENDSQLIIPKQSIEWNNDTLAISGSGSFKNEVLSFQYSEEFTARRDFKFQFSGKKIEKTTY